jgi:hypothetical protein
VNLDGVDGNIGTSDLTARPESLLYSVDPDTGCSILTGCLVTSTYGFPNGNRIIGLCVTEGGHR